MSLPTSTHDCLTLSITKFKKNTKVSQKKDHKPHNKKKREKKKTVRQKNEIDLSDLNFIIPACSKYQDTELQQSSKTY